MNQIIGVFLVSTEFVLLEIRDNFKFYISPPMATGGPSVAIDGKFSNDSNLCPSVAIGGQWMAIGGLPWNVSAGSDEKKIGNYLQFSLFSNRCLVIQRLPFFSILENGTKKSRFSKNDL